LYLLSQKRYYKTLKHGYARGTEPVKYVDSIYDSFCGANEGAIYTSIIGGVLPYDTVYWSNGITDSTFIDSLDVGTYSLVVIDNVGCIGNMMIDIFPKS